MKGMQHSNSRTLPVPRLFLDNGLLRKSTVLGDVMGHGGSYRGS